LIIQALSGRWFRRRQVYRPSCPAALQTALENPDQMRRRSVCLKEEQTMTTGPSRSWECDICGFIYDESEEGTRWEDLPDDWECPVCGATRDQFTAAES
jgi:rubredoxin